MTLPTRCPWTSSASFRAYSIRRQQQSRCLDSIREVDKEARYDSYEVPFEVMSVLDVIKYIYENLDHTLSFREACKIGWCGSCVVMVSGKAALSCQEMAEEERRNKG